MIWFDASAAFARRFEQVEGGYLYYPSAKSGGKLVTPEEYEKLVGNYRRWAGRRFRPGLMLWAMLAGSVALEVMGIAFGLSVEALEIPIYGLAAALTGVLLWSLFAPYRLLKNRPDATPPRSRPERARAARAMLPWSMVVFGGLFATVAVLMGLVALGRGAPPSIATIAWTVLWAAFLASFGRTALQKYRDGRRR